MSSDNDTNATLSQAISSLIEKFKNLEGTNYIRVDDVIRLNIDEISKRLNIDSIAKRTTQDDVMEVPLPTAISSLIKKLEEAKSSKMNYIYVGDAIGSHLDEISNRLNIDSIAKRTKWDDYNVSLSTAISSLIEKIDEVKSSKMSYIYVGNAIRWHLDEISNRLNISSKIQMAQAQKKFNKIDDVMDYMEERASDGNMIPITTMKVLVRQLQDYKKLRDGEAGMIDGVQSSRIAKQNADSTTKAYGKLLSDKAIRRLNESEGALTAEETTLLKEIGFTMKKYYENLLQQERAKVESQKDETIQASTEFSKYMKRYDPAMEILRQATQKALEENLVIKAENAQLQLDTANFSQCKNDLAQEKQNLALANQAVTNAKGMIECVDARYKVKNRQYKSKKAELEKAKKELERLTKENKHLKEEPEILTKENKHLKEEFKEAKKENECLKEEFKRLQKESEILTKENKHLKEEPEILTKKNKHLKEEFKEAKKENECLKEEFKRLKEESERLKKSANREKAAIATHVEKIISAQVQKNAPYTSNEKKLSQIDVVKKRSGANSQATSGIQAGKVNANASNLSAVRQMQSTVQNKQPPQPIKEVLAGAIKPLGTSVKGFFDRRINKGKGGVENNKGKGGVENNKGKGGI